ncbi:MAG: HD-GYP domain-containing protein [Lachnospiraceae bacterium]|nr:HD-GYP domain-containing protein [Lachnospiraceae bacterium]MBR5367839.1 HD-GYP domain-containing protein [Lachnospiraceae bacterium]
MEVKRININDLTPGMLVADNVYNSANQLIVPRDVVLTDKAITRMRFHSISSARVYVSDENASSQKPASAAPGKEAREVSFFEKLRGTEEFIAFNQDFEKSIPVFEQKLSAMLKGSSDPDNETLTGMVDDMFHSCRTGIQLFNLLHCMRNFDDVTFSHSINVSLICGVLGTWLGRDKAEVELLMQCGIYHDVGKLLIPKAILDKPGKLSPEEYALVKTHTTQGYNVLKDRKLPREVKLAAMMHHERCDGSGYPMGLKGNQIEECAKILAIADVYEAMTSPRVYRKALCPFEVIHLFEVDGLSLFDPVYLLPFMENITQSYVGNQVRLSDGTIGQIIFINKLAYSRPVVKMNGDEYVDLSKESGRTIMEIL